MPQTVTFTLRIPKPLKDDLQRLAEAMERPQAYVFTKALEEHIESQRWQVQAIRAAVKKADSPKARFVPHVEVVARVKELAGKTKRFSR